MDNHSFSSVDFFLSQGTPQALNVIIGNIVPDLNEFALSGLVNIVGGCCGTTADHVREIAQAVEGVPPRVIPQRQDSYSQLSGLETLTIHPESNFQMIGERTNVTGSAKFARLIRSGDSTDAVSVALDQVRGGANLIDVNMDEAMLESEQTMARFLNFIATEPEIARVPFMICLLYTSDAADE